MQTTTQTTTALDQLAALLSQRGSIPTARVSSAKARGAAKAYSYWGAVRYEVRLGRDGQPINVALEAAGSDRRSTRLVRQDLAALCAREGRIECPSIGRLTEEAARGILLDLASDHAAVVADLCD